MFEPCVAIVTMVWLAVNPATPTDREAKVFVSEVLPDRELCEIHGAMRVEELKQDYGNLPVRYTVTVQAPGVRM